MKDTTVFPVYLVVKVAIVTGSGLIVYFMLMKILHLAAIVELRFFNLIILFIGINYLMKKYRQEQDGKIEYLTGLGVGFMTSFMTSAIFAVFVYVYLSFIDPVFMAFLKMQRFGNYLTPETSAFLIIVEGVSSGAIITFALLQYYRGYSNVPRVEVGKPTLPISN